MSPPEPAGGTKSSIGTSTSVAIGVVDGTSGDGLAGSSASANTGYTPAQPGKYGGWSIAHGNVAQVTPSALTDTVPGSANGGSVVRPVEQERVLEDGEVRPGPVDDDVVAELDDDLPAEAERERVQASP